MSIFKHFKVWNEWRKRCLNPRYYKFLVLIGVAHSPTFEFAKATYGIDLRAAFEEGMRKGKQWAEINGIKFAFEEEHE